MDAVTAVSGSGPAYVFLLAEASRAPASPPGCRRDLAARLARATVAGSGELLHRSALDAATLRQNVTSPGGTTAAALDVLMGPDGLDPLMNGDRGGDPPLARAGRRMIAKLAPDVIRVATGFGKSCAEGNIIPRSKPSCPGTAAIAD